MYNLNEKLGRVIMMEIVDINQYPLTLEFFKMIDDFVSKNYPNMEIEDNELKKTISFQQRAGEIYKIIENENNPSGDYYTSHMLMAKNGNMFVVCPEEQTCKKIFEFVKNNAKLLNIDIKYVESPKKERLNDKNNNKIESWWVIEIDYGQSLLDQLEMKAKEFSDKHKDKYSKHSDFWNSFYVNYEILKNKITINGYGVTKVVTDIQGQADRNKARADKNLETKGYLNKINNIFIEKAKATFSQIKSGNVSDNYIFYSFSNLGLDYEITRDTTFRNEKVKIGAPKKLEDFITVLSGKDLEHAKKTLNDITSKFKDLVGFVKIISKTVNYTDKYYYIKLDVGLCAQNILNGVLSEELTKIPNVSSTNPKNFITINNQSLGLNFQNLLKPNKNVNEQVKYNLNEEFENINKKYLKEGLQDQMDSDYVIYEDDDILVKALDPDNQQENKLARTILTYPISKVISWIFIVGPVGIVLNKETDQHIIFTINLRRHQQTKIWFKEDQHDTVLDGGKIKELFGVDEQAAKEIIKSINNFNSQEYLENAFDGEEYMALRMDAEEEATKDLDRELINLISEYSGIDIDNKNFHHMFNYVIKNCRTHKDVNFLENDDFETNYDGELFCIYDDYDKRPEIKSEIKKCVERGLR